MEACQLEVLQQFPLLVRIVCDGVLIVDFTRRVYQMIYVVGLREGDAVERLEFDDSLFHTGVFGHFRNGCLLGNGFRDLLFYLVSELLDVLLGLCRGDFFLIHDHNLTGHVFAVRVRHLNRSQDKQGQQHARHQRKELVPATRIHNYSYQRGYIHYGIKPEWTLERRATLEKQNPLGLGLRGFWALCALANYWFLRLR